MNHPITKEGFKKLQDKKNKIQENRKVLISKREDLSLMMGDQSENSDYNALLEDIEKNDIEYNKILTAISESQIKEINKNTDTVKFGHFVTLENVNNKENIKTYQIVGTHESNISECKISSVSPVAIQLLNKSIDDEIYIGEDVYFIKEISLRNE